MKQLTAKVSFVATVFLFAALPSQARAASGSLSCPPDEYVRTYVGGTGTYHWHTVNGYVYGIPKPDNTNIYYSNVGWTDVRSGSWETHTSITTTTSSANCVY